jgi:hypothetical protein
MEKTWREIIEKLSEKQRHVLGMIAINEDQGHPPTTIHSLVKKQLILPFKPERHHPASPPKMGYMVPIPVHIAWCEWCSDNYKEEEAGPDV